MNGLYGAFLGDIAGSVFEESALPEGNSPLFARQPTLLTTRSSVSPQWTCF
jgi:hypothetical protein